MVDINKIKTDLNFSANSGSRTNHNLLVQEVVKH